ncbi:hypothetical protein [Amphritea pacifica]|uniref:hypothetical protein n=1 Tax=Amphritea pacifica TaxID=2811233 RepID=UPI0019624362|nr:hypothetical protein [Amphritea pacifica]MBN1006119.1 hypothetical protein [Amphritea pacifica]
MRITVLNVSAKLALSGFLITVILAALSATTLIGLLYSSHDRGFNIPEMDRIQSHYSDSRLIAAMKGPMYQYVTEDGDIDVIAKWIAGGAKNDDFFKDEVMYILSEDCQKCHSRNSQMSRAITSMPFSSYEDIVQYTEGGYSWTQMARTAHIHLFGIAVFLVIVSLIMAYSSYRSWMKSLLISAGWIALWLDIGSWWLARFYNGFAYVISVAGTVEIGAVCAMSGLCLLNLWCRLPAIVLEPEEHRAE